MITVHHSYILMCLWVIFQHVTEIPEMLITVLNCASNGHAATGGFLGATFMITAQQGIVRGIYAGDIGVGFDSILQNRGIIFLAMKKLRSIFVKRT